MNVIDGLSYDDVLLVPQYSEIESRSSVNTCVDLGKGIVLDIPIVSANMKTITGPNLAREIALMGGLAILHRFDSIKQQIVNYKESFVINSSDHESNKSVDRNKIGVSVGVNSKDDIKQLLDETGTRVVCVDVAHGDHKLALQTTSWIAKKYPEVLLIAGNIATAGGAKRLAEAGADVCKAGIGSGSICSTRTETGNGVPQLTALEQCYEALKSTPVKLIADGGIKRAGDAVKGLCFSHAVMLGGVLSGTEETPGNVVELDGLKYKQYAGSSTHKKNHIEGVAGLTPYKGSVKTVVQSFMEGIRSGLSYQGCENLEQLRDNPVFVRMSSAGLAESLPHANLRK